MINFGRTLVMKRFISCLLLLMSQVSVAQIEKHYTPVPIEDTIPRAIYDKLKQKLDQDKAALPDPKSKPTLYQKGLYDKRFEFLVNSFNQDYFITQSTFATYVQGVLKRIYDANPQLPRETQVYVYRSAVPNAISFGDGTLGFTLGLLARMESDDEVAFVLCHELAHHHQQHATRQMQELTRLEFDKALEAKVKTIRSSGYGTYSQLKELYKQLGLSVTQEHLPPRRCSCVFGGWANATFH